MATREYIGARYVPKFYQNSVDGSTQWEANVVYDPLIWVTLQNGHMYISKKQVPATVGTPAENINYWLDIGSYNGMIADLQNQIDALDTNKADKTALALKADQTEVDTLSLAVTALETDKADKTAVTALEASKADKTTVDGIVNKLPLAQYSAVLTVGRAGAMYTTINAAITDALTYATNTNRVCILIFSGTYTEEITLFPNTGIDLVGIGDVTVQYESVYPNSPLYISGNSYIENIKFLAFSSSAPSYGVHIESAATNCELKFVNCQFSSVDASGLGIGTADMMGCTFINCKIISWNSTALYAHNFPGPANAGGQQLKFYGCEFLSGGTNPDATIEDARYRMGYAATCHSYLKLSFPHCIFHAGKIAYTQVENNVITVNQPYLPKNNDVSLDNASRNTLYSVDSERCFPTIHATGYGDAIASCYLAFPHADKYTWTASEVLDQSGTNVTGNASIYSRDAGGIRVLVAGSPNQNCVFTLTGVPV